MSGNSKPVFGCCFCGDDCDGSLLLLAIGEEEEDMQQWWAHPRCLADSIHEAFRHFAPWLEDRLDV